MSTIDKIMRVLRSTATWLMLLWAAGAAAQAAPPQALSVASDDVARPTPQSAATGDSDARYRSAVDLGFKEFKLGNYAEAQARFREAADIDDNARVLRALGMVAYELRNYPKSIAYLEQALLSTRRALGAQERAETAELLRQAHDYVARYKILTHPETAELLLDNAPLALDAGDSVMLRVGPHSLLARAPSYLTSRRDLQVVGGQDETIVINLDQVPAQQDAAEHSGSVWRSPWLWAGVGAVAVGAGVLLAFALQPEDKTVVGDPQTTPQSPGVIIQALEMQ